jgi:peptide chain release factor 1
MFDRLQEVENRFDELDGKMQDPSVWGDPKEYQRLAKAHAELRAIVEKYRKYKKTLQGIEETDQLLRDHIDDDMRELAQAEFDDLRAEQVSLEKELNVMLLPKDPNDEKSVLIEVRAGTGGEEAALFAAELMRMYSRYAERRGWKTEVMSVNETGIGGVKEVIIAVDGLGAYSQLKYESGVHRVQRVPETESSGRIHTSAATVAVMPEAEEVEVYVDPEDLQIDTYRSSSAGGQNVQKNETAIRITHKPSGVVVTCQDERSQLQNKEKAMRMLRSILLEKKTQEQNAQISEDRRSMVGSGDRSEKIRTYNYPQGRITDHRIGYTIYRLDTFLDGDIQDLLDHLVAHDQSARLNTEAD